MDVRGTRHRVAEASISGSINRSRLSEAALAWSLLDVEVEFSGVTSGPMAPAARVFRFDRELPQDGSGTIVASASAVPRGLRWGVGARYCAAPRWRDLKRYLTSEVFLPNVGVARHPALLDHDRLGHAHVRFAPYAVLLTAGVAMFYRVCEEAIAHRRFSDPPEPALIAVARPMGFEALFERQFERRCADLVAQHGAPVMHRSDIARRTRNLLLRAISLAEASGARVADAREGREARCPARSMTACLGIAAWTGMPVTGVDAP